MKLAFVISEFNPYHNGHSALLREAKRSCGLEAVCALMSGDYVQRGEPAICDRFTRAEMALKAGYDAVFSFPTRFSSSTARSFAEHAVEILNGLDSCDTLVFGSESGDLSELDHASDILLSEPDDFHEKIDSLMKRGYSFPRARAIALPELAAILDSPNNILAVEYLRALKKTGSRIRPFTVTRQGSGYHNISLDQMYPSAEAIRHELLKGGSVPESAIPSESCASFEQDLRDYGMITLNDFSVILADRLWHAHSADELTAYEDVDLELANAFLKNRNFFKDAYSFSMTVKNKSLTLSRIHRALLHIALDIRKDPELNKVHGTRLLGIRRNSMDVISFARQNSSIPVVISPSREMQTLGYQESRLLNEEMRVSNLYNSIRCIKTGGRFTNVLSKELIKV